MKNVGASVKAKLKNESRALKVSMDFMLIRYAAERLLGRLAASRWADTFCLKGGMLLPVFNNGEMLRPTADIDLNGIGEGTIDTLVELVRDIAEMSPESEGGNMSYDDGLTFDVGSIKKKHEQDGGSDGGKVEFFAYLDGTRIKMRIDVGFNKPITPEMITGSYPCLLRDDKKIPMPSPRIHMYPPETMIAEKMHAVAFFQAFNTRTRDYYDLYTLLNRFDFDDEVLGTAIRRTFEKEGTAIPTEWAGLSAEYAADKAKDWKNFNKTTSFRDNTPEFCDVLSSILERMEAPLERAREASKMSI